MYYDVLCIMYYDEFCVLYRIISIVRRQVSQVKQKKNVLYEIFYAIAFS